MSTDLATITESTAFSSKQLDLIKTTIAPGVDDDQLALFIEIAKRTGLDPFSRQIYAILRNASEKGPDGKWQTVKKMTVQTGIDGYRAMAARTGALAGIDDATYDTEDADHPHRASVTVWRFVQSQRVPFSATARWQEYAVYKDEYADGKKTGKKTLSDMWDRMPYLMLGKCAEALALRKAFPNEISGVYTAEEMDQATDHYEPQPTPTTPTTPATVRNAAGHAVNTATGEVVDAKATLATKPADEWAEVRKLAKHLALSDAERDELFKRHKKNRDAILTELRDRYERETTEPDVEFTVAERDLSELAMAQGGRLN